MSVKERIKVFCKAEGMPISAFESSIGVSNGYVNAISKSIGIDRLNIIIEKYSNLNIEWLLTGKGEMIKTHAYQSTQQPKINSSDAELSAIKQQEQKNISVETRPRIPFDAAAGSLSIALGSVSENDCERLPLIPILPRYDFTIIARGESMEPQYMSGDELACLFIKESSFIQWGRTHVLDTAQGIVVKRIYDHGTSITCKSNNPDYPDFDIPKEDIYRIALVVGYLRIE